MHIKALFQKEKRFLYNLKVIWCELKYIYKVVVHFFKGFNAFRHLGPCVTFFGSSKLKEDNPYYGITKNLSYILSKSGFTVMTGGGPGLMEAANKGAKEAGGMSVGCNLVLESEQKPNKYLDKYVTSEYFFIRKELLRRYSCAFIITPGGFGTLDELFEIITLIQTKKNISAPIIIIGKDFHKNLVCHINKLAELGIVEKKNLSIFLFTDDINEATEYIKKSYYKNSY